MLAVVEDQQARRLTEALRDPSAHVGALLGRQDSAAANRIADAEHRPDLSHDVLGGGDANQLDDVHNGHGSVAREDVRQPRLPHPARADDRHDAGAGHQRPETFEVTLAADQRACVVADAAPHRLVKRQKVVMRALQLLTGIGAEPLTHVAAVAVETLERGGRPADGCLGAQEVRQQRLIVGAVRVRRLECGQRLGVRAHPAAGPRQSDAGGNDVGGSHQTDVV